MTPDSGTWIRSLVRLGLAAFTFFVAFGSLLPVFPLWAERLGGSLTHVGIATTFATGVGLVMARPLAARLMEGRRRVPVLALGALVTAVASLGFPFLPRFDALLGLRWLQGVGFGLLGTAALSAVTDLAPAERRAQVLGYYGAGNAVSLLVGPAAGAWVAQRYGLEAPFFLCAALCLVSVVFLPGIQEPPKALVRGAARLLEVWRGPLRVLVCAHFFALLLHGVVIAFLPLRLKGHAGWMSVEAFFAIDAVVTIGLRLGMGHRFDRLGRAPFLLMGLACFAGTGLILSVAGGDLAFAMAAVLYGLGFGAYLPAAAALVGDLVPETQRARGFAIYLLAFDISVACGGAAFGPLADAAGLQVSFAVAAAMAALAAGILCVYRPWGGGSSSTEVNGAAS